MVKNEEIMVHATGTIIVMYVQVCMAFITKCVEVGGAIMGLASNTYLDPMVFQSSAVFP